MSKDVNDLLTASMRNVYAEAVKNKETVLTFVAWVWTWHPILAPNIKFKPEDLKK